ncbi:MAG: glycerol-3-phosphate dehydrogenase/oxidase [Planctomycetaceae bacterium]|nr:glycerol-3-phosphate dehydrogenase/oxidase [Planctomycetaceae bacterium]
MQPVLILGGGINGAALARELAWQGIPVVLVDAGDLASGATAYSSRLIHGGLRYLEYAEFRLVAESLAERARLVNLAPHHVKPLRLWIPVARRSGGLLAGALKFLGLGRWSRAFVGPRGSWVVRLGLSMYDWLARQTGWPRHVALPAGHTECPQLAPGVARWLCGYFDAQIAWPERFVVALCDDARRAAMQFGTTCEIYTHTTVAWRREQIELTDRQGIKLDRFAPAAIINATGAWVDHTLAQLQVESLRLMAGTKGSHLVVDAPALREWLGGDGLYIEASDGRPVFVLPWEHYTLVGTTDLPFTGDPRDAVADSAEIEYLLAAVNRILPQGSLGLGDVLAHYCGVRPLPAAKVGSTAAVTRRHWLETHVNAPLPFYSIIGGKLTTCRSLAESTCDTILKQLQRRRRNVTQREMFGGSRGYPPDLVSLETQQRCLADEFGLTPAAIRALWRLFGTATSHVLAESTRYADDRLVVNTDLPRGVVRWVIAHEWVETLDDLVARRLLLVYDRRLTRRTLVELAELLSLAGKLPTSEIAATADREAAEIARRHGRVLSAS